MPTRFDFIHDVSNTPAEQKMQQEALAMLRARKAAEAIMDREAAAKDAEARWVRQQVAASKPAPSVGGQRAAQAGMISRSIGRPWTPEPAADPARLAAAMRMDGVPAKAGVNSAAAARQLMLRRLGGR